MTHRYKGLSQTTMGKLTAGKYIKEQFMKLPKVSAFKADLTGKTVIVVGANTGLGLETARHFAGMQPGRLILGCRTMEKAAGAVEGEYFSLYGMIGNDNDQRYDHRSPIVHLVPKTWNYTIQS